MFWLIFWVLAQEDAGLIKFTPISAGNKITMGSFEYVIPDGCFYAGEENVHNIFHLAGAEYIPNAVGMFFSASANWNYSVTVQHFPYQHFILQPRFSDQEFFDIYSRNHLYTLLQVTTEASYVQNPTFGEDGSFTIGMKYRNEEGGYDIYFKKLWATEQDALLFSVRATEAAFQDHYDEIDAALNAVVVKNAEATGDNYEPVSYLELIGLSPNVSENAAPEQKTPVWPVSILLLLIAGGILYFAFKINKKQTAEAAETGSDG